MNDDLKKRFAKLMQDVYDFDFETLDQDGILDFIQTEVTRAMEEARGKGRLEVMNQRWSLADELCDSLGIEKGRKLEEGVVEEALMKIEQLKQKAREEGYQEGYAQVHEATQALEQLLP